MTIEDIKRQPLTTIITLIDDVDDQIDFHYIQFSVVQCLKDVETDIQFFSTSIISKKGKVSIQSYLKSLKTENSLQQFIYEATQKSS